MNTQPQEGNTSQEEPIPELVMEWINDRASEIDEYDNAADVARNCMMELARKLSQKAAPVVDFSHPFPKDGEETEEEKSWRLHAAWYWKQLNECQEELRALKAAPGMRECAITFAEWAAARGWILYPDCDENEEQGWYKPSGDFDIPDERMFGGQLYDLFLRESQTPSIPPKPIDTSAMGENPLNGFLSSDLQNQMNQEAIRMHLAGEDYKPWEQGCKWMYWALVKELAKSKKTIEEEKPEGKLLPLGDLLKWPDLSPTEVPEEPEAMPEEIEEWVGNASVKVFGLHTPKNAYFRDGAAMMYHKMQEEIRDYVHAIAEQDNKIAALQTSLASITAERDDYRNLLDEMAGHAYFLVPIEEIDRLIALYPSSKTDARKEE